MPLRFCIYTHTLDRMKLVHEKELLGTKSYLDIHALHLTIPGGVVDVCSVGRYPGTSDSTHILHFQLLSIMISQIQLQRTTKQLQQHLKAHLANRGVIPPLAEFVADKRIYRSLSASPDEICLMQYVRCAQATS